MSYDLPGRRPHRGRGRPPRPRKQDTPGLAGAGLRVAPGADRVILTRGRVIGFGTGIAADATGSGTCSPISDPRQRPRWHSLTGHDNTISKITVQGSGREGIRLAGTRNAVANSYVDSNSGMGVDCEGADNAVSATAVIHSGGTGLEIHGDGARLDRTVAKLSGGGGLLLFGSGHEVSLNTSVSNAGNGFGYVPRPASGFHEPLHHQRPLRDRRPPCGSRHAGTANTYSDNLCGTANWPEGSSPARLCR